MIRTGDVPIVPKVSRRAGAHAGAVWVTDCDGKSVWRVDPEVNLATSRIPIGRVPVGFAVGAGAVWVVNADGTVTRVDPEAGRVVRHVRLGERQPVLRFVPDQAHPIAVGEGAVWVTVR